MTGGVGERIRNDKREDKGEKKTGLPFVVLLNSIAVEGAGVVVSVVLTAKQIKEEETSKMCIIRYYS